MEKFNCHDKTLVNLFYSQIQFYVDLELDLASYMMGKKNHVFLVNTAQRPKADCIIEPKIHDCECVILLKST